MDLKLGMTLSHFTVEDTTELRELEGHAWSLRHESGARLLYVQNEDNDKSFSIGFKTPPADDTGVFHILEHSVLCGSEKFPVKEPFVNLLKSSMQTFLNAMTFPDKTMYPVSSTNEKDLYNLMDVYIDAVLHPNIYSKPEIFMQEAWHFELESLDAPLRRNGVVYNEMKGVFSSPDSVLYSEMNRALFPNTAYAFDSGGHPEHIGDLTYEEFLEEHRKHYRLDNSYLFLYGNLHIEQALAFIDERLQHASDVEGKAPNELGEALPVEVLDLKAPMATSPEQACVGLGVVLGSVSDRKKTLAAGILIDALLGSNEAPLKQALLSKQLGADLVAYIDDARLQPLFLLELRGSRPDCAQEFLEAIESEVKTILDHGLDRELIEAALSHEEFELREGEVEYPAGIIAAMNCLNSWLYNDEAPFEGLKFYDIFTELKSDLEHGYFEALLKEIFLDNHHRCLCEIVPSSDLQDKEADELAKRKAELSEQDCKEIMEAAQKLQELQIQPDSAEALASLPMLKLEDLVEPPTPADAELQDLQGLTLLYRNIPSKQISYLNYYFDISGLKFKELKYAAILVLCLGKLDTKYTSAAKLDTMTNHYLGKLAFSLLAVEDLRKEAGYAPYLAVEASALDENFNYALELPREIWSSTCFNDKKRIYDRLLQHKHWMETMFSAYGNAAAKNRLRSYLSPKGIFLEETSNIEFYAFLEDLLDHFDVRFEDLSKTLSQICTRIFTKNCVVSLTGPVSNLEKLKACGDLNLNDAVEPILVTPEPELRKEAFIISGQVNYVCLGNHRRALGLGALTIKEFAPWTILARLLRMDYLWNEVRVLGGAYGANITATREGFVGFDSFRDPHIDATVERNLKASAWVSKHEISQEDFEGYVIATLARMDAPLKPAALMVRQDTTFLSGYDPDIHQQLRAEVLKQTQESVQKAAQDLKLYTQDNYGLCIFGTEEAIKASSQTCNVYKLC